jgi:hypothetical protein
MEVEIPIDNFLENNSIHYFHQFLERIFTSNIVFGKM